MPGKNLQKLVPPKASNFESTQEYFDYLSNSRDACSKRGYHRVSQDEKEPFICYDCDLWFDKNMVIGSNIKYKVESFSDS